MILIGQYDSPFVRRVAIALRLYGLEALAGALPPIKGCAEVVGAVTPEAAELCGLAPGLSHLLVGRAIAEHGTPDEVVSEKTLRWPGHVEAIRPLLAQGRLVETFRARCTVDPPEDLVVLAVRGRWGSHTRETLLVDRYDPRSGRSAMSRTTALTTSACAQAMVAVDTSAK